MPFVPRDSFWSNFRKKVGGKSANPGLPANDWSVQVCFVRYMRVCSLAHCTVLWHMYIFIVSEAWPRSPCH